PSRPSSEKSSQNRSGLAHHLALGQPVRCVTLPSATLIRLSANEPNNGESLAVSGFVMKRPCRLSLLRYSFRRLVVSDRMPLPGFRRSNPAGLSSENAIATFACSFAVFATRYRSTATGNPEASASRGTIGVNASRPTVTGRVWSWNWIVARGYSPIKLALSNLVSPETWLGL